MNLTSNIIAAGTGATPLRAAQWVLPLQAACDRFEINAPLRLAAFLAQIGHESAGLSALVENLNYSAPELLSTFPSHFTEADAAKYARQPERIANRAYANRNGNGDESSGDGWKYRGRACLQVTGRRNYQLASIGIDLDLIAHPELLEQPSDAALASAWWWSNHYLNGYADVGQFLQISRMINLGSATKAATPNGYPQRLALYGAAKRAFGIA
ncbi:putative chitinase [Paraburkholderia sp. BL8N3]|nr:glycoside hydrolase family 19 protein [Paraburkholderia sp. BL8N3]TCK39636.1 putative chitinase [Paraburkholderia sp. BL8N3]